MLLPLADWKLSILELTQRLTFPHTRPLSNVATTSDTAYRKSGCLEVQNVGRCELVCSRLMRWTRHRQSLRNMPLKVKDE
jgi:hypothetical protein